MVTAWLSKSRMNDPGVNQVDCAELIRKSKDYVYGKWVYKVLGIWKGYYKVKKSSLVSCMKPWTEVRNDNKYMKYHPKLTYQLSFWNVSRKVDYHAKLAFAAHQIYWWISSLLLVASQPKSLMLYCIKRLIYCMYSGMSGFIFTLHEFPSFIVTAVHLYTLKQISPLSIQENVPVQQFPIPMDPDCIIYSHQ